MSYTYYNSSAASMGAYMKYRARLGIDTSDGTESTAIIKWIGAAQSTQISGWGIKIAVSSSGNTSGYSGSKSGSDTGVVSSSTDFETDAKTSGTLKIPRGHSSKSVTIKATVSGTTVNGHTGVTAGSESVSDTISIRALDSYTIKYNFNGGKGTCDSQTKWYGETLTLREGGQLTRSGYKIVSWNTTSSGSGTSYQLGGSYTKNAGDTLYAIWEPRTYTISFNSNGGSSISTTIKVIYNSTYGNMPTPTRTGYTFAGWYTSSTGGTKITSSTKVTIADNDTLYAHWTINNYTLTYQPTGGTVSPVSKTLTYGATYGTLPTPARTGYTFTGWYTSETGGSQVSSSTTMGAGNRTIFAHWQIKIYSVSYNANGGSNPPATQTKTYGVNLTLSSSIPTKDNYNFTRWNTKSDGTGTNYSPGQVYSDDAQLILHAQWEVAHQIPKITNLNIIRVDGQGKESDEGEYGRISFNYEFDSSISAGTAFIEYKTSNSSSYNQANSITLNSNKDSVNSVLTKTNNNETTNINFSQDEAYNIRIYIEDSDQYSSQNSSTFLSKAYFIMDIYGQNVSGTEPGHGIGFGAPAEYNKFKIGLPVYLPTNTPIYGVNNSNQNVITIPMIQSVTDSSNYVKIGSNNYATHILGSTININGPVTVSGAATLSNTLTVSGATTINNSLTTSGNILLSNDRYIYGKETGGTNRLLIGMYNENRILIGDYKGSTYHNAISIRGTNFKVTSDGNATFSGNITALNHDGPIGEHDSLSKAFELNSSTSLVTTGLQCSLKPGIYIIWAEVSFDANTTGRRGIGINVAGTTLGAGMNNRDAISGTGYSDRLSASCMAEITTYAANNIKVYAFQSTGAKLNGTAFLQWARIR